MFQWLGKSTDHNHLHHVRVSSRHLLLLGRDFICRGDNLDNCRHFIALSRPFIKARGVADSAYNCNWQEFQHREWRRALVLIIARAQKPVQFSANGFIDVNIKTFTNVKTKTSYHIANNDALLSLQIINASFSYFMLLRQMKKRR